MYMYINSRSQICLKSSPGQKDTRKLGTILSLDYNYILADFELQLTLFSIEKRRVDTMSGSEIFRRDGII
jgi:hypothetical protein